MWNEEHSIIEDRFNEIDLNPAKGFDTKANKYLK